MVGRHKKNEPKKERSKTRKKNILEDSRTTIFKIRKVQHAGQVKEKAGIMSFRVLAARLGPLLPPESRSKEHLVDKHLTQTGII
jgi:hypothetical protein